MNTLLFTIMILLFSSCESGKNPASEKQNNEKTESSHQSQLDSIVSETEMLIGYNAPGIFFQFQNGKPSKEIVDLYKALNPEIIRFPGGTLANHYRFSRPGYGRDLKADNKFTQNFIYDFIQLMKELSDEPKVIYVMNFFEHFGRNPVPEEELIEENMNAVKTLIENGIEVVAIELGNELYIYPEVTNNWFKKKQGLKELSQENVSEYLRLAKKYTELIDALNPDIKVGLPMGKFANPLHKYWNEELLKTDFADAYICHYYGRLKNNCNNEACFKEQLNQFIEKISNEMNTIKKRTGKDIWVTEWNAINFGFNGDKNLKFAQTPLHIEYNNKFIEAFERSGVEICNYHRISGPSKKPAYNLINISENNHCETSATFDAFVESSKN